MSPENPQNIQTRHNPEPLPDSELLDSQRALLKLTSDGTHHQHLHGSRLRAFGRLLSMDMLAAAGELEDKDQRVSIQQKLWYTAKGLVAPIAPKTFAEHTEATAGEYLALDGFRRGHTLTYGQESAVYNGRGIFTPSGIVLDSESLVKQSIIELKFSINEKTATESYRNRPRFLSYLRLYADNLSATTPFWEFKTGTVQSDILPTKTNHDNAHFMHSVPERFGDDEQALSVIEKLSRIVTSR